LPRVSRGQERSARATGARDDAMGASRTRRSARLIEIAAAERGNDELHCSGQPQKLTDQGHNDLRSILLAEVARIRQNRNGRVRIERLEPADRALRIDRVVLHPLNHHRRH